MRHIVALFLVALLGLCALARPPLAYAGDGTVIIHWTAPGDDSLTGTAHQYDVRYSVVPITEANFPYVFRLIPGPAPAVAGTKQSAVINYLDRGRTYWFAVKTQDDAGNWSRISNIITLVVPTTVDVPSPTTTELHFSAPSPNPAHGTTSFEIGNPVSQLVHVEAFDISGRRVATLMDGVQPAGTSHLHWDLRDAAGHPLGAGLYLVRAMIGSTAIVRRVMVER